MDNDYKSRGSIATTTTTTTNQDNNPLNMTPVGTALLTSSPTEGSDPSSQQTAGRNEQMRNTTRHTELSNFVESSDQVGRLEPLGGGDYKVPNAAEPNQAHPAIAHRRFRLATGSLTPRSNYKELDLSLLTLVEGSGWSGLPQFKGSALATIKRFKLILQIKAPPFSAGLFGLSWFPSGVRNTPVTASSTIVHGIWDLRQTISGATRMFNLSEMDAVEYEVENYNPTHFLTQSLANQETAGLGDVVVTQFSPISVPEDGGVAVWTLWMEPLDTELQIPHPPFTRESDEPNLRPSIGSCVERPHRQENGRVYEKHSLNHLTNRWGFQDVATWQPADSDAGNLALFPVTPQALLDSGGVQPTPARVVGSLFNYWRGTMKYKFVFVGSSRIEGIVRIALQYGDTWDNTPTPDEFPYKTVDMADTREVEFEVPYAGHTTWRDTELARIELKVVNPLRPFPGVKQSVDIWIFHAFEGSWYGPRTPPEYVNRPSCIYPWKVLGFKPEGILSGAPHLTYEDNTLETVAGRMYQIGKGISSETAAGFPLPPTDLATGFASGWETISTMFAWWKADWEVTIVTEQGTLSNTTLLVAPEFYSPGTFPVQATEDTGGDLSPLEASRSGITQTVALSAADPYTTITVPFTSLIEGLPTVGVGTGDADSPPQTYMALKITPRFGSRFNRGGTYSVYVRPKNITFANFLGAPVVKRVTSTTINEDWTVVSNTPSDQKDGVGVDVPEGRAPFDNDLKILDKESPDFRPDSIPLLKKVDCPECGVTQKTRGRLINHIANSHPAVMTRCQGCGFVGAGLIMVRHLHECKAHDTIVCHAPRCMTHVHGLEGFIIHWTNSHQLIPFERDEKPIIKLLPEEGEPLLNYIDFDILDKAPCSLKYAQNAGAVIGDKRDIAKYKIAMQKQGGSDDESEDSNSAGNGLFSIGSNVNRAARKLNKTAEGIRADVSAAAQTVDQVVGENISEAARSIVGTSQRINETIDENVVPVSRLIGETSANILGASDEFRAASNEVGAAAASIHQTTYRVNQAITAGSVSFQDLVNRLTRLISPTTSRRVKFCMKRAILSNISTFDITRALSACQRHGSVRPLVGLFTRAFTIDYNAGTLQNKLVQAAAALWLDRTVDANLDTKPTTLILTSATSIAAANATAACIHCGSELPNEEEPDDEEKVLDKESPEEISMITAIIAALGFGCYASGAITGSWAAFTSKMANLLDPRHLTRVAGAGDLISRGFQKLCEVFGLQPLKDNAKVAKLNISQLDNILLFSTRVMELRNKTVTSLTRDWRTRHEVHELYKTAREISTQLIGVDARKDPLLHQWSIDAKYVTDIWKKVAKVPPVRERPVPVVLTLQGDSQIGKSTLTSSLIPMAVAYTMNKKGLTGKWDMNEPVYTYPIGAKFMDGYDNNRICVFDDFLQSTDQQELDNFNTMTSSVPMTIPMADLTDKGMLFTSDLIILSMNTDSPDIKKMTDHTSLFNRMYRHYYNVSVRPEYREGLTSRLDASKLTPKHEPDDYLIFTKFEYTRPETGGPLGRQEVGTCTFKEIIQRVCHSLEKAYDQASNVNVTDNVKKMAMKIMDREAPPSPEESDGEEYWEDRSHLPPFFDPDNPEATEWEIPEGPFADFLARDDVLGDPDGSWYERTRERVIHIYDEIIAKAKRVGRYSANKIRWLATQIRNSIAPSFFEAASDIIESVLPSIGLAIATMGTFLLGRKVSEMVGRLFGFSKQGYDDGQPKYRKVNRPTPRKREPRSAQVMGKQGPENALTSNHLEVFQDGVLIGRGIGVKDTYFLYPSHCIPRDQERPCTVTRLIGDQVVEYPVIFKPDHITGFNSQPGALSDLVLVHMGNSGQQFKDITRHFIDLDDEDKVLGADGELHYRDNKVLRIIQLRNLRTAGNVRATDGDEYEPVYLADGRTRRGLCGSPWISTSSRLTGPRIIGIHVLGKKGEAGACKIAKGELATLIEQVEKHNRIIKRQPTTIALEKQGTVTRPYHTELGKVPKAAAHYVPNKTIHRKTTIDIGEEVTHGPAVLSPRDPRLEITPDEFREKLLNKTNRPTPWQVPQNILEEVARAMAENFYDPGADLTPHSLDAVINGNQDLEHTKDLGLKMNKSPGYPWSKAGPKSAYFVERPNSDGERKFYDPDMTKKEFWERVQERDDLAQQGVVIRDSVWTDVKKDELRPIEKIKVGKTRIINSPPLDLIILMGKYLGPLRDMMMHPDMIGVTTTSALGMDPIETWNSIAWKIRDSHGVFGIDYTQYDSTIGPYLYDVVIMAVDMIYERHGDKPEWKNARHACFYEACHTIHLFEDELYEDHHGNPSGFPAGWTTLFNIMVNFAISCLAYHEATGRPPACYTQDVEGVFMGDDNLQWIINPEIKDVYTRESVVKTSAKMGMTATTPKKDGPITPYDDFNEVTFLKRHFKRLKNLPAYMPAMDTRTIINLTQWERQGFMNRESQLQVNIKEALGFAAAHGEEYYNSLQERIIKELRRTGQSIDCARAGWRATLDRVYKL